MNHFNSSISNSIVNSTYLYLLVGDGVVIAGMAVLEVTVTADEKATEPLNGSSFCLKGSFPQDRLEAICLGIWRVHAPKGHNRESIRSARTTVWRRTFSNAHWIIWSIFGNRFPHGSRVGLQKLFRFFLTTFKKISNVPWEYGFLLAVFQPFFAAFVVYVFWLDFLVRVITTQKVLFYSL